jgi:putative flippase GtrA
MYEISVKWASEPSTVTGLGRRSAFDGENSDMHDAVLRVWGFSQTSDGRKMVRYTMVSVICVASSFLLLGIVFGVLRLWSEVPSTLFANIVMLVPNYYLNRNWVWGKTGRSHWRREILPFWTLSVSGIGLSIVAAAIAHHISHTNHLGHLEATALLFTIIVCAFGTLWTFKFVVFNRLFRMAPAGVPDTASDQPNVDTRSVSL